MWWSVLRGRGCVREVEAAYQGYTRRFNLGSILKSAFGAYILNRRVRVERTIRPSSVFVGTLAPPHPGVLLESLQSAAVGIPVDMSFIVWERPCL